MLISELIAKLQRIQDAEGDREIGIYKKHPNEPLARLHDPELCTHHEATDTQRADYKISIL